MKSAAANVMLAIVKVRLGNEGKSFVCSKPEEKLNSERKN